MSIIGKKISPFNVQAYQNNDFRAVSDKDLQGHWSVLVFYPADFTFVCPTELGDLADHYAQFQAAGCEVYSISTDSEFVHKAWHDTSETIGKIKFPMLSDQTGAITRDLEVMIEEAHRAYRGSFVINPDGVVVAYEVNDLGIGRSATELLRRVEAAQFVAAHGDQVCPANWTPGADTLKPGLDLVGKI